MAQENLKEGNSVARNTYLPLLKTNREVSINSQKKNTRIYNEDLGFNEPKKEKETKKKEDLQIESGEENQEKKEDDIDWGNYKPKNYSLLK